MKYLIASDIHGCAGSAQKIVEWFENLQCDRMLLLGDILYHGPSNAISDGYDPKETIKQLNSIKEKIIAVRGNCDAEVDQVVLEFPITAEYQQIPFGDKLIFATHGHHVGLDNLPPIGSCDVLLCGHTHVPGYKYFEDLLYVNPGSTSIPKFESKKSFMTFDGKTFRWYYIDNGKEYDSLTID